MAGDLDPALLREVRTALAETRRLVAVMPRAQAATMAVAELANAVTALAALVRSGWDAYADGIKDGLAGEAPGSSPAPGASPAGGDLGKTGGAPSADHPLPGEPVFPLQASWPWALESLRYLLGELRAHGLDDAAVVAAVERFEAWRRRGPEPDDDEWTPFDPPSPTFRHAGHEMRYLGRPLGEPRVWCYTCGEDLVPWREPDEFHGRGVAERVGELRERFRLPSPWFPVPLEEDPDLPPGTIEFRTGGKAYRYGLDLGDEQVEIAYAPVSRETSSVRQEEPPAAPECEECGREMRRSEGPLYVNGEQVDGPVFYCGHGHPLLWRAAPVEAVSTQYVTVDERCHEDLGTDPCGEPATGTAFDREHGSYYPACEKHRWEPTTLPPWSCLDCGQRNAGWARECGRCGRAREEEPLDLLRARANLREALRERAAGRCDEPPLSPPPADEEHDG